MFMNLAQGRSLSAVALECCPHPCTQACSPTWPRVEVITLSLWGLGLCLTPVAPRGGLDGTGRPKIVRWPPPAPPNPPAAPPAPPKLATPPALGTGCPNTVGGPPPPPPAAAPLLTGCPKMLPPPPAGC
eukprot:365696-Chlamydomonas_euryale.AAC.16